ncbi:hypothetical protein VB713_22665 [Anabaena cylindrica UHCC 0172]|uniref:hypothetical protein n=1 Tax=Anabaena cylindrica TaxID=1165 RepID=UPI002B1EA8F1|nr:hypothetical protein [Anabaena cylindrica]MEA5553747.1 hypothetical protein [Anabaena cylindrica UHCC 0172]
MTLYIILSYYKSTVFIKKSMRLKRWESPRKEGRNDKGRGGSARKRQLKKQRQMLRNKLKEAQKKEKNQNNQQKREGILTFPFFWAFLKQKSELTQVSH